MQKTEFSNIIWQFLILIITEASAKIMPVISVEVLFVWDSILHLSILDS